MESPAAMRTLRDHIETTRTRVHPPDLDDVVRYERMYDLRVDGTTLGEIRVDADREGAKRRDEIHALGHALIGCEADRELVDIRSLKPRPGRPTPDFEATTAAGGDVRIELVRLVDDAEKKMLAALQITAERAENFLLTTIRGQRARSGHDLRSFLRRCTYAAHGCGCRRRDRRVASHQRARVAVRDDPAPCRRRIPTARGARRILGARQSCRTSARSH